MTYQEARGRFVEQMRAEGVPEHVSRLVLRHAATVQRLAELACSSEAADRDRVLCPSRWDVSAETCMCRDYGSWDDKFNKHGRVPRYMVLDAQKSARIETLLKPYQVVPVFGGDPRGACVKLVVPSGKTDDWGRTGLCVPTR